MLIKENVEHKLVLPVQISKINNEILCRISIFTQMFDYAQNVE